MIIMILMNIRDSSLRHFPWFHWGDHRTNASQEQVEKELLEWLEAESSLYHFGGYVDSTFQYSNIFKFDSTTNTSTSVGRLPGYSCIRSPYITSSKDKNLPLSIFYYEVQILQNQEYSIVYEFNTSTHNITPLTGLYGFTGYTSVVLNNYAYTFNGWNQYILKINIAITI